LPFIIEISININGLYSKLVPMNNSRSKEEEYNYAQ
jgi:hypothetical protein